MVGDADAPGSGSDDGVSDGSDGTHDASDRSDSAHDASDGSNGAGVSDRSNGVHDVDTERSGEQFPVADGRDAGAASHRALRGIRRELERHPLVDSARGFPVEPYTEVVADLAGERLPAAVDDATLTVRWYAGDTAADPPEFSFHYSDYGGDFGWHHAPNPHVDGWGHYQERPDGGSYDYEPYEFDTTTPTRVVWEVVSRLEDRLAERSP